MRTPDFWNSKNPIASLLLPAAWLYDLGRRFRVRKAAPVSLPIPVICVGNVTAGGAGKTPVTMHIGKLLKAEGVQAFFLSRGYGGSLEDPVRVKQAVHTSGEVGDEPLMLAEILPTVVAKDRLAGARYAMELGAELIVMDDGLQNLSLTKALSIIVVDGTRGFGNGYMLPAGPLREPPSEALSKADAVVVINPTDDISVPQAKQILTASTSPVYAGFVKDKRWMAFCGIAYPDKFFATLHNLGGHVMGKRVFADHHPYSPQDIASLRKQAATLGAGLITTAKDIVRIAVPNRTGISVVNIAIQFDDEPALAALISRARTPS